MYPCELTPKVLRERDAAVLGFGRSGRAVTEFLLRLGKAPTVYTQGEVAQSIRAPFARRGVRFFDDFPAVFPQEILVRSPGIRPDIEPIRRALSRGACLTGECDLFLSNTAAYVIGVTGSDGKTTTANLIAAILREAGVRAVLGGNNGTPLLPYLGTLGAKDVAVIELSSFQLMTAPAPDLAVLTNITPNHLNWHLDLAEYTAAKCRIFAGAKRLVTSANDPVCVDIAAHAALPVTLCSATAPLPSPARPGDACVWAAGDHLCICDKKSMRTVSVFDVFSPPGAHNRQNLACAVGAVAALADDAAIRRAAASFAGVPHRLQTVATVGGVRYIDSSIDTSPTRTAAALRALDCRPLVIAGGRTKGIDLTPLGDTLAEGAHAVFLYGEAAAELEACLRGRVPYVRCEKFADAFHAAASAAVRGQTVLLSPGCTAFGEFRDFEDRAEVFCRLVKDLERKHSGTETTDPRAGGPCERHGI